MITIAIISAMVWWKNRRGVAPTQLTPVQSRARIRELRSRGYKVEKRRLPDGTTVVLRSRTATR